MSISQEDLMKQMLAGGAPAAPIAPIAPAAPATNVAPGLTMPIMPTMTPSVTAEAHVAPVGSQVEAIPAIHDNSIQVDAVPAIQVMVQPEITQTVAQAATDLVAAPAIGGQLNLQNGLNLDEVMTPEAEVKIVAAEVQANPIIIGGLESIGSCKTSVWSAMITILDFIAKELSNNDIITIDKGTIDTQRDGIFIHCDMQNILGNISLNLTAPDKSVKLLKLIKGGELVQIFKEDETNSYIFCNIQDSRVLTQVKTSYAADNSEGFGKAPILGNPVFQKEIPQSEKEIIKTIIAGKSAIGSDEPYRFGFSKEDNSLVSIGVGKDFTHFFKESSIGVDEYRCYNPFPVPNMDSCIIRFFKKTEDNTVWVQTISNINPSSIICTEKVELIDSSIEDFNFQ